MATKTKSPMFETRIEIEQDAREELVALLNQHLADAFALYSHSKQAHWNVKGMDFMQLHELFDELAELVLGFVDMIAERITALGGTAMGTVHMAGSATGLEDIPIDMTGGEAFVEALAERFAQHAEGVREAIDTADQLGDMATSDLFTEIVRGLDKSLYFLEAHLRG
ncbi:MAG: DNA starvation/stationary phase protection protein Dps [Chloroflexi bacterium]|nr:DNA starvation/stationary phase protection protein Dps [Chloroflexota bacterium]